jgi:hypothetical protein
MDELCELFDSHIPVLDIDHETFLLMYSRNKTIDRLMEGDYLERSYNRFKRYQKYIKFMDDDIPDMIDSFLICDKSNRKLLAEKAKRIDYYIIRELQEEY